MKKTTLQIRRDTAEFTIANLAKAKPNMLRWFGLMLRWFHDSHSQYVIMAVYNDTQLVYMEKFNPEMGVVGMDHIIRVAIDFQIWNDEKG